MRTVNKQQPTSSQQPTSNQQPTSDLQKLRPWLPILVGSLFALAFLVVLIIARDILPLSLPLLIIASLVFLLDKRVRPNWLEVEFLTLCLAGLAIWLGTMGTTSTPSPPDRASASFTLPADKIQSDLTCLAGLPSPPCSKPPINNVMLVLVSDHAVQNYNVTLLNIKGVGSQDHKPPYNKDAVEVDVRLPQGVSGDKAGSFASQLQSVKSIYLFPSTLPAPPTLSNPTFVLPIKIIGSDLRSLRPGNVVVVLVVNNQLHFYPNAMVTRLPSEIATPTPTSAATKVSATPTPAPTVQQDTVGVAFTDNNAALDFANLLPNASTIYLLQ